MTPTQPLARFGRIALVGALLLTGLASLPMASAALTWSTSALPSNGQVPTRLTADTNGEVVGLVFIGNSDGNAYFLRKDTAAGSWSIINSDITTTQALTNANALGKLVFAGGNHWLYCNQIDVSTAGRCWHSSDNGATWTITAASYTVAASETLFDIRAYVGGTVQILLTTPSACNTTQTGLFLQISTDYGATFLSGNGRCISDNQGDPTDADGAAVSVQSAVFAPTADSSHFDVYMSGITGSPNNGDLYHTTSTDGFFWDVTVGLFTAEGSTTRAPLSDPCGNFDYQNIEYGTNLGSLQDKTTDTLCVGSTNIPSASPTNSITVSSIGREWLECNSDDQCLLGFADLTANANYVWFANSPGTTYTADLTNSADTQTYAVAITDTTGYFFYSDNTAGGQLKASQTTLPQPNAFQSTNFCSDFDSLNYGGDPDSDFGYNYAEGVTTFDDGPFVGSELSDGYEFIAQSDNFAYLGKGWTPGSTYARTVFRIEASVEGTSSVFRTAISLNGVTPSASTKGNGVDTQSFNDHLEAYFQENGAVWQISIRYVNGGSLTQVGANANIPFDPNTPHTFSFTANTAGNGYAMIKDEDGDQVLLNRTMAGSGLPGFEAMSGGDPLYAQWFVASGSSSLFDSDTFLDDSQDTPPNDEDSTCIFTSENGLGQNTTFTGDQGSQPPSTINVTNTGSNSSSTSCDSIFCVSDDNTPIGFTTSTFNFFLGLLLMIAVGVGIYFVTKSPIGFGIGVAVGYLMGLAFGLLPLWPIIVLTVAAIAFIFIKSRGSGA